VTACLHRAVAESNVLSRNGSNADTKPDGQTETPNESGWSSAQHATSHSLVSHWLDSPNIFTECAICVWQGCFRTLTIPKSILACAALYVNHLGSAVLRRPHSAAAGSIAAAA